LDNNISVDTFVNLNGTGIGGTGALRSIGGTNDLTNNITLSGNTSIGVDAGSTLRTFSPISGAFSLTKVGAGVLDLGGASTYSGGTTVSAGKLLVNNFSGSGTGTDAVTVASGATLGGSGIIDPSNNSTMTSIQSGATMAPGNSAGKLTIDGSLSLANDVTAVLDIELDGQIGGGNTNATTDQLIISGSGSSLTINGARLNVMPLSLDVTVGTTGTAGYKIINLTNSAGYSSAGNLFANLNGQASDSTYTGPTYGYSVFYNDNDGVYINFSYVPEPLGATSTALLMSSLGLMRRHKRRESQEALR
jgi:autotransporter-associated beta strand protein